MESDAIDQVLSVSDWPEDQLNRKKDADFLTKYISEKYKIQPKDESFVININAEWGFGKSFFLKKWKSDLSEEHPVIYYDAWKNDFSKHPLSSFLYVFREQIIEHISDTEDFKKLFKGLVSSAIKYSLLAGGSYTESLKNVYEEFTAVQDEIRNEIDSFLNEINALVDDINKHKKRKLPIYVMIDEMDRCRPNYSIELLEVIKHLFCTKHICFIIATDSRQLEKSIKVVYGSEFDTGKYLNRFFNHEYSLSEPDNERFANYIIDLYNLDCSVFFTPLESINLTFSKMASYFRLPLREQHHAASLLEAIKLTFDTNCIKNVTNVDMFFMLFLIMLKLSNKNLFYEYTTSQDKTNYLRETVLNSPNYESSVSLNTIIFTPDKQGFITGGKQGNIKLVNIIVDYQQLVERDLVKKDWHPDEARNEIKRKLLERLYEQIPSQFTRGKTIYADMVDYIGMVKQIGQLT